MVSATQILISDPYNIWQKEQEEKTVIFYKF